MIFMTTTKNYMNLPKEYRDKDRSSVVILPISFKIKTTRENDAHLGPEAIINASEDLEYFDEESFIEPYEKGIFTDSTFTIKEKEAPKITHKILDKVSKLPKYQFPVILGSDHFTSVGTIKGMEKRHKEEFGVIIFDAHSDLRTPWGKDTWWHACITNLVSKDHKTLLVGTRSMDYYDTELLKSEQGKNIDLLYSKDLLSSKRGHNWDLSSCFELEEKLRQLPKKIYISIDVDVFDPSIIRYTDTPEPGGLNWTQVNNLLKKIFEEKEVIGIDLVEFSPDTKNKACFCESFTLAKLVYKIIGYKYYK